MQENGGGDYTVSRVRQLHQGSRPLSRPAGKKLPVRSRSTVDLRSMSRGNFNPIDSVWMKKKKEFMLPDKEGTTSSRLCWGRWIPGCTSYTAAQWGCCLDIDLVDPVEPLPRASPRSSAPVATWRRKGRGVEGRKEMKGWKKWVKNRLRASANRHTKGGNDWWWYMLHHAERLGRKFDFNGVAYRKNTTDSL